MFRCISFLLDILRSLWGQILNAIDWLRRKRDIFLVLFFYFQDPETSTYLKYLLLILFTAISQKNLLLIFYLAEYWMISIFPFLVFFFYSLPLLAELNYLRIYSSVNVFLKICSVFSKHLSIVLSSSEEL